jgi:exodeoxyribonuclease V alpha subunit
MQDTSALFQLLTQWVNRGWLRALDLALVRFFKDEAPEASAPLLLAAALVSHQLGRGHVGLDLQVVLRHPRDTLALPPERDPGDARLTEPQDLLSGWSLDEWLAQFRHPSLVDDGSGRAPLVLAGHRLYLRRYWRFEREVEGAIRARMQPVQSSDHTETNHAFQAALDALFPKAASVSPDWQRIACAVAARSAFSVITGGPGTGKTTTVVRLLALLQQLTQAHSPDRPLVIRLAAPTGKAAARLKQSISTALHQLLGDSTSDDTWREHMPTEVITLHRLLGTRRDTRQFRHHAGHPLALDVLVIDEASMVDLEMMAATLQALPAHARLILLGDKDQLASVEAGSVLGELCHRATDGHYLPALADWVQTITGQSIPDALIDPQGQRLDQHIVMLRHSHRFDKSSGIGLLAAAVNAGDVQAMDAIWAQAHADLLQLHLDSVEDSRLDDLVLGPLNEASGPQGLGQYMHFIRQHRPELDAEQARWDAWALRVLAAHGRFQLLCALRNGPWGVKGLNARIEMLLKRHQLITPDGPWYVGRPVLVTRNDYALDLMNGDIGIALPYPVRDKDTGELDWTLRVAFPTHAPDAPVRWVLPSRLSSVETVYALTVHKSQGSEFEHVALLLPPEHNPVLTRELIYTGITRGKSWFSLITTGHPRLLQEASLRTVQRAGGLFDTSPSG